MSTPTWDQTIVPPTTVSVGGSPTWNDTVDLEEKYGGLSGELKAGAAGAARGATFGLSDVALTKSGLVKPETLKGLQEQNPASSFAGEIAGTVAPAFLGDEASLANLPGLVSRAGGAVEGAATAAGAGRALAKGVGFTAEGAAYGLGQSVSEAALGDHDLVSEQTLANIGLASAMSGGLGALVGGVSAKLADRSSAAEKLAAEKLSSSEDPLFNTRADAKEKLSLFEGLAKRKGNAKEIEEAGALIGAPVTPGQISDSKFVQDAESALTKQTTIPGVIAQQKVAAGFDAVENAVKESFGNTEHLSPYDAGALIKEQVQDAVDKIHEPIKAAYAERAALGQSIDIPDKARLKLFDQMVAVGQNFGAVGSEGGKLIEQYAERALSQNKISQLDALIQEVGSKQRMAYRAGDTEVSKALSGVTDTLRDFQVGQMAKQGGDLSKLGVKEAEELTNQAINQHKEVTKQYREFKGILNDLASDQRLGKKNLTHGVVESVLDGIPNEKVLDKMFDPKNADGLARLKKNFPEVFQTMIEQKKSQILQSNIEDGNAKVSKILKQVYDEKKLSSKVREMMFSPEELKKLNAAKTWIESLPKDVNPSGTSKAEAFREFLNHPVKAAINNFTGVVTQQLIDKFAASPEESGRLMTLINTERAAQKTAKQIKEGVSSIFEKSTKPVSLKIISKISSASDYREKTDEIKKIANNPQTFTDTISANTEDYFNHAPGIGASLQQAMIRGNQFLASKILPTQAGIFEQGQEPAASDIAKFNNYYQVVHEPAKALEQVKNGTIVPDTIEALSVVWPKVYADMKEQMLSKITSVKDPSKIPYQTRLAASFFLGEPLDKSFSPYAIQSNQQTFSVVNQQAADKSAMGTKPSSAGMGKITLAQRSGLNHGVMES